MKKVLLFLGAVQMMLARGIDAPEIDASTGTAALALLSGGLMVLRSRRAKK
jgi:hypothetical protein